MFLERERVRGKRVRAAVACATSALGLRDTVKAYPGDISSASIFTKKGTAGSRARS
jgi:hypothetical protein